jgi:hypothetical protein
VSEQPAGPVATAQSEAAKQAVALIFGLIGVAVMVRMQKRAAEDIGAAQRRGLGPDSGRTERMTAAQRREHLWAEAGRYAARLAGFAWEQAERARRSYEQDTA